MFADIDSLLACGGSECVFCSEKELANKHHLFKKHLKDAVSFNIHSKVMKYSQSTEKGILATFSF